MVNLATVMRWRARVNNKKRYQMPTGTGTCNTYMLNINDDGCQCLVCSGSTDKYAEIQSYREGCDLSMLLRNIDPKSLNNAVSSFSVDDLMNTDLVDYSSMPNSIGGLFNLVKQGENFFNGLPEDVRAEFNYSVKNFVSKFGSQEFSDILAKYMTPPQDPVNPTEPVEPTEPIEPTEPEGDD